MSKKKILIVINSLECGGAEKSLTSMLSLLDYNKYEVYLQRFSEGGIFENLLPREVKVLPLLPYFAFCKQSIVKQMCSCKLNYIITRINTRKILRKNIKKGRMLHDAQAYWKGCGKIISPLLDSYDIAIAWGQGNPTHFVAEKVAAKKKIAWINVDYKKCGLNRDFDFQYYKKYQKIIAVSDVLTEMMKKVFPEFKNKMETIFDINNYDLIQKMSQEPIELKKKEGIWCIVTTARLALQKGYDIAIEAAKELKKRGTKFQWYVIGEGGLRNQLEKLIEENGVGDCFHLLGAKANPYPYMKSADIYVQTSRFEGFCITLAEARMLNIPCVTTEFDVVYNQMVQGENGLVVKIDPISVADGIQRLIEDRNLYNHIREYQMKEKKGNCEEIKKIYRLFMES